MAHLAVGAAVVIGVSDEEDGEHLVACVALKKLVSKAKEDEIRRYAEERVDDRKKLRVRVVFVNSFPTTTTRKVSRTFLRDLMYKKSWLKLNKLVKLC